MEFGKIFILRIERLSTELYFLIGNILIPPCIVLWIVVFTLIVTGAIIVQLIAKAGDIVLNLGGRGK